MYYSFRLNLSRSKPNHNQFLVIFLVSYYRNRNTDLHRAEAFLFTLLLTAISAVHSAVPGGGLLPVFDRVCV